METHWIVEIMELVFLMPTNEFGVTLMMMISLKLVIFQKVYILDMVTKNMNKLLSGSGKMLLAIHIRTGHNIASVSVIDKEFSGMYKINHTKEVMKDLNVFRI